MTLQDQLKSVRYSGPARVAEVVDKPAPGVHARRDVIFLEAGRGARGNHPHASYWKGKLIEGRDVTAMSLEVLDALGASSLVPGDNLITEGVDLRALRPGDRLRIGSAILERSKKVHGPCDLFARRISPAARQAVAELSLRGALFVVVQSGEIRRHDPIHITPTT